MDQMFLVLGVAMLSVPLVLSEYRMVETQTGWGSGYLRPLTTYSDSLPEQTPDLTTLRATTVCQRELVTWYNEADSLCQESPSSAGNPVPAPIEPEVVSFVIRQLQGGLLGTCLRSILKVSGFMKKVNIVVSHNHSQVVLSGRWCENHLHVRPRPEAQQWRLLWERERLHWAVLCPTGETPGGEDDHHVGHLGLHHLLQGYRRVQGGERTGHFTVQL